MKRAEQALLLLRTEIAQLERSSMAREVTIELAFRTADRVCASVGERLSEMQFPDDQSEILFFKTIWSQMIAEKEYYKLLNYAISFCPAGTPLKERRQFWEKQLLRPENYRNKYLSFFKEVEAGASSDHLYFTGEAPEPYAEYLGMYQARERYATHARQMLDELNKTRKTD